MKENITKKKLLRGESVIGTFITINSAEIAQVLSQTEYDYLMLDFEHGAMSVETLGQQISTIKLNGTTPLVRVPSNTIENVKKALDSGAYGLMLPMVKNADDVKKFVSYSNFPPKGIRGSGAGRANDFYVNADKYFNFEKTEILRIIQIETKEAVENIDEILKVDGIDVAFVGPFDLSFALGTPGNIKSEIVSEAIELVAEKCKEYGKIAGIMSNEDQLSLHLKLGYKFILLGLDSLLLYQSASNDINYYKEKCECIK